MKLNSSASTFEGHLPTGTRHSFVIKSNPHLFNILSDGIYADKIMAVIRELSCNAHDSNVTGRSTKPFTVNVPTQLESNFWVEDTGLGIDPDKIVDIFWTYGASTKTESNDTIGALGLGSKSPFAYTKSSFLVINRYNGIEYKYFCFINEAGIPDGKLVYQSATDQPNGVRVELAVRTDDIRSFRDRIIRFFSFWDEANLPTFHGDNTVLTEIKRLKGQCTLKGKNWELRNNPGVYAVMGGVPYPITRRSLPSVSPALEAVCSSALNITFPMGSLNFQVSREELSYDDGTIKALEAASKQIVEEILESAKARMKGYETPFELSKAYYTVHQDLRASFVHVANMFATVTFTLKDGRKFTAQELTKRHMTLRVKGHSAFNVQQIWGEVKQYARGRQSYGLRDDMKVDIEAPEVRNAAGALLTRKSANVIPWFKQSTVPAAQTNTNRMRTPANYLHANYSVISSFVEPYISNMTQPIFIINDLGDRGSEGIRFYAERFAGAMAEAYMNHQLYFIDASDAKKAVAEVEAELRSLVQNTLLEGMTFQYLSKLPAFKFMEAPKAAAKPRAPIQRGTIEQRIGSFKPSSYPSIAYAEAFELKLPTLDGTVDYRRHDLTVPLLYVKTNWGAPIRKELVAPHTLGALHALGLLDKFTVDGTVRIAYMSDPQIEECKRRKMTVVNIEELLPEVEALVRADHAFMKALQNRADDQHVHQSAMFRMTEEKMRKNVIMKLDNDHPLRVAISTNELVKTMLLNSKKHQGLMFMLYSANLRLTFHKLVEELKGKMAVDEIFDRYPLITAINAGSGSKDIYTHIMLYIKGVDAHFAAVAEAAKLAQLESLHAEAIFEQC